MIAGLPSRALCWYGDDFTGSTDVLEAVAPHLPSVLFLRRPSDSEFAPFAGHAAFGLAGSSRSETPAWMDAQLPAALEWLKGLGAAMCLYKVCSTFDSSPGVGNIGRAMEIGRRAFDARFVPIVAGAPSLRRYTFFGHLFAAAADGEVYRIDRHPAMMRHPVTPMDESDLRVHLGRQTAMRIGLLDARHVESGEAYRRAIAGHDAVLMDVAGEAALAHAGRLLWEVDRQPFMTGSSGAVYALIAHWTGGGSRPALAPVASAGQVVVLSGSCSQATARQLDYADRNGYGMVAIPILDDRFDEDCIAAAMAALARAGSRGVAMFTSRESSDRIEGLGPQERQRLGERAGRILHRVWQQSGARRAIIAGGDTSSHAGRQLGIAALTFLAHMAPGAPLCRAWPGGLEVVFKGGQCGDEDFFETVRKGNAG